MTLGHELFILLAGICLAAACCRSGDTESGLPESPVPGSTYLATGRAAPDSDTFRRLKASVDSIRLIDTHEHLTTEQLWLAQEVDLFYWFQQPWFPQYAGADLVSAGMPEEDLKFIGDPGRSPEERWARMAPWWPGAKYTGFGQALRIAAREIHGVPDIDESTWGELSGRIAASKKPGFYHKVLHQMAGIDLMVLDQIVLADSFLAQGPPPRTVRVKRFDTSFISFDRQILDSLSAELGSPLNSLDDLLAAMDKVFEDLLAKGYYVGLKNSMAYDRAIFFEDTPRPEAERVFGELLRRGELTFEERRPLEDFMMHRVVERAGRYGLPIQVHTGLQAGPGNTITNSRPTLLINLFQQYPETRFILFHGSFPYMGELATLAKNFRNVYLDFCWLPVISPTAARLWLHQWLETVPANKIMAFGGDYLFPEGAYGHSRVARQVVAETLAEKVESGYLSMAEAEQIARMLLRENAIRLFRLERFL
ncbi:MAG: amidohydrolase [Candidatus Glassbacteria bacterium]|nr:amidohydrolase [Candidatus Glassbacteria bacterium]